MSSHGRGPTAAFLNPYPRDFRMGTFKFKSTPIGMKPTDDDLRRILLNGVAGTAMPSFKLLNEGEIFIVPKGIDHRPIAEDEAHIMMFEPVSTAHTGDVRTEMTVDDQEWI